MGYGRGMLLSRVIRIKVSYVDRASFRSNASTG